MLIINMTIIIQTINGTNNNALRMEHDRAFGNKQ